MKLTNQSGGAVGAISSLRNWHSQQVASSQSARKGEEAVSLSFEDALEKFEKDADRIKAWDRTPSSPTPLYLDPTKPTDTDSRAGEVDVPGVGSLHSTPEGFSLRAIQKGTPWALVGGYGTTPDRERSYQVDEKNGTIAVTNFEGPSNSFSFGFAYGSPSTQNSSGYTESYTINTKKGTIENFRRNDGGLLGASSRGLMSQSLAGTPDSRGAADALDLPGLRLSGKDVVDGHILR